MTSQVTQTKSPTSQPLTLEQRFQLINFLADRYLDSMDVDDLARFFHDAQREYLEEYNDDELIGALEDVTGQDEYEETLEELINEA